MFEGLARKQHLLGGKSFPHGFSTGVSRCWVDSYTSLVFSGVGCFKVSSQIHAGATRGFLAFMA